MNFEEFTEKVKEGVSNRLHMEVKVESVPRNNGIVLTGLIILDTKTNTSPTIYLNDFYKEYQTDDAYREIEDIVKDVCVVFNRSRFDNSIDLSDFLNFETAKKNITFKLINYSENAERLEQMPHRKILDLAVVYNYLVQEPPFNGRAFIQIRNEHMEEWGITEEELYRTASFNTPGLLRLEISNIEDIMLGLLKKAVRGECDKNTPMLKLCIQMILEEGLVGDREKIPMYVMTNSNILYGAAVMLYPDSVKAFAEKMKSDLYILPSSVHEVILVKAEGEADCLKRMVREINRKQVEVEERLSDNVYIYRRDTGTIEMA